jgi:hypothetical protein
VALIDFHASATNVVQIHFQVATQSNHQLKIHTSLQKNKRTKEH